MVVAQPAAEAPAHRRLRARTRLAIVLVVVVLAAIASYAVVRYVQRHNLDARYGPITEGPVGGIVGSTGGHVRTDRDLVRRISGAEGTQAGFVRSIRNDGSHAVVVTGVDLNDDVVSVRWSVFEDHFIGVRDYSGVRPFPATVPADGIYIVLTVRKPNCSGLGPGGSDVVDPTSTLAVHWRSLLDDHLTPVSFNSPTPDFSVC